MFDIKISIIMSNWQTLKHNLALANAILRKTFRLTLKGNSVRTGNPTVFELQLMDCFTYVNGVTMLKLPSSKLIKSYLNQPKPLAPVGEPLFTLIPEAPLVPVLPPVPEGLPENPPEIKHLCHGQHCTSR